MKNTMGIIVTTKSDKLLKGLTKARSMAAIPFGGRYRLIDFPLSNMVNKGIGNVGTDEIKFKDSIKEIVYAYPIKKDSYLLQETDVSIRESEGNIIESINYIGNDYVSIESIELGEKNKNTLKVFPVDNIRIGSPIKISDIVGESGKNAF